MANEEGSRGAFTCFASVEEEVDGALSVLVRLPSERARSNDSVANVTAKQAVATTSQRPTRGRRLDRRRSSTCTISSRKSGRSGSSSFSSSIASFASLSRRAAIAARRVSSRRSARRRFARCSNCANPSANAPDVDQLELSLGRLDSRGSVGATVRVGRAGSAGPGGGVGPSVDRVAAACKLAAPRAGPDVDGVATGAV